MKFDLRDRSAIGGAAGLLLLAAAFAYRWLVPQGGDEPMPAPDLAELIAFDEAQRVLAQAAAQQSAQTPAPVETPVETPAPPVPDVDLQGPADLSSDVRAALNDAMARGEAALAAGRAGLPPDDSAIYWFEAALELDPADAEAKRGLDRALEAAYAQADVALDAGDPRPGADLIAALAGSVHGEQWRTAMAQRIETLPRVEDALREGAQRMAAGQRFEPEGASALDSYLAARTLDPRSVAANQGLAEIERIVLTQALAAASDDRFDESDRLMSLAGEIAPGSQTQLETRTRIVELQRQRAGMLLTRAGAALDGRNADLAEELIARAQELGAVTDEVEAMRERVANARLYDHLEPGAVFDDPFLDRNGNAPDMVVIPVGESRMGSPSREPGRRDNEGPQHALTLARPFALGRTEVTVAQFRRFVREADHRTDAENIGSSSYYDEKSGRITNGRGIDWRSDFMGEKARDADPVVHVSWNDARAYADWLAQTTGKAYRLPTEAEFEYALRAGSTTRWWWGNGNPTRTAGNFTGDGDRSRTRRSWTRAFERYEDGHWGPAPAGTYPANPFGVFDLDGNVSEWVEDCWHDSYVRAPEDGSAWVNKGCGKRVVRGGSWASVPDQVRSAYRISTAPDVRGGRVGIRVARDL